MEIRVAIGGAWHGEGAAGAQAVAASAVSGTCDSLLDGGAAAHDSAHEASGRALAEHTTRRWFGGAKARGDRRRQSRWSLQARTCRASAWRPCQIGLPDITPR